jgi:hypothetical protein
MGAEEFQSLGLRRDAALRLIDHHAAGHALSQPDGDLPANSQFCSGPVILVEGPLGPGVDDDVGAEAALVNRIT